MKVGDRVEERSGMEVGAGVLVGRQVLISLSLSLLYLVFVLKIPAA